MLILSKTSNPGIYNIYRGSGSGDHRLAKVGQAGQLIAYTYLCGSGSGVEHHLAKVRVAGSNLVFRSIGTLYDI